MRIARSWISIKPDPLALSGVRRPLTRGVEMTAVMHGSCMDSSPLDYARPAAREWSLYISTSRGTTSIGIEEPPLFSEPGVFIVRPDGTLYYGAVQTMPFARPHFDELLAALDVALNKSYAARGEYIGAV